MLDEAESWVGVAFVIFFVALGYLGVHKKLLTAIDDRRRGIRKEVNEASLLKAEAQALLEDTLRKRSELQEELRAIMDTARAEADHLVAEAKRAADEFVRRRKGLAAIKIAQAESRALVEVRSAAAEFAVAAAEQMLTDWARSQGGDQLLAREVGALKQSLASGPQ
jgi:F-type H+-transporting ATPase subunit b